MKLGPGLGQLSQLERELEFGRPGIQRTGNKTTPMQGLDLRRIYALKSWAQAF